MRKASGLTTFGVGLITQAAQAEAARQEAARAEAARQDAVKQAAARDEAARQELARQAAAREEAARLLQAGLDDAQRCGDPGAFHGYLGLADLAAGEGDLAAAFALLAQAERLMQRQRVSETLYRGTLLLASGRLWLHQGHRQRAREAATRVLGYARRVKVMLPPPKRPSTTRRTNRPKSMDSTSISSVQFGIGSPML